MTDANLVLGYLDAEHFLGGRRRLDAEACAAAMDALAARLGTTREEAAATVRSVLDTSLSAEELHAAGADTWSRRELEAFLDAARVAVEVEPVHEPWSPPGAATPPASVVDISTPHPTEQQRARGPLTPPVFRPGRAAG